ncbi:zinc-binding dehydrogenase [Flavihumibacter rivuli]|uniref:zinc-binding dehydrogenase n=1 Tax=Flavihumibacter rivuli TaxID=2838156 RepID=UPI001BDE2964|nr:zinc-binding dehydrogenase [Flavihumibacter rivuli]ULQ57006.1 zinc-binding dehydrogenase [Flavihumibacter rivuli]
MKALLFRSKDEPLRIAVIETPQPAAGEVLIRLHYAAINHRDLFLWKEKILEKDIIPGSDGSGVVAGVGAGVDAGWIGKEVLVNPSLYWGGNAAIPSEKYEILGVPTNGTFAEYMVIPQNYVYPIPQHLELKEAAAIPLASLTAYRALFTKARLAKGEKVLVTGIGGGVAIFLLQMAVASGAEVYVSSSSDDKLSRAVSMGARAGFNYRDPDWVDKARAVVTGFDVIIDSAGGSGFEALTELANPGARIVNFGRTAGNEVRIKPSVLFNKQLTIMGTLMGNDQEFADMLAFYERHQLQPAIEAEYRLEEYEAAIALLEEGRHFGKLVFNLASS